MSDKFLTRQVMGGILPHRADYGQDIRKLPEMTGTDELGNQEVYFSQATDSVPDSQN
jgi:hypothetical protein